MIEKAIDFIQEFIKKEHQTTVDRSTERNDEVFTAKKAELEDFFGQGLNSEVSRRPDSADENWFQEREEDLELIQPRQLFQVKEYEHPTLGTLYRCYVSTINIDDNDYFACYYVGQTENGLKIISQYNFDLAGESKGLLDHGLYWNWRGGIKLKTQGKLVKIHKLQAPDDDEHLQEYEAE